MFPKNPDFSKPTEKNPVSPCGIDELKQRSGLIFEKIRELFPTETKDNTQLLEETREKEFELFLEGLIRECERFARIFRTESGSLYFELQSDGCLRAARRDGKKWALQQPTEKTFFLSAEDASLLKERARNDIMGKSWYKNEEGQPLAVKLYPAEIGRFPLELGLVDGPKVAVEIRDGHLLIIDKQRIGRVIQESFPYHFGHPIAEIIWDKSLSK